MKPRLSHLDESSIHLKRGSLGVFYLVLYRLTFNLCTVHARLVKQRLSKYLLESLK